MPADSITQARDDIKGLVKSVLEGNPTTLAILLGNRVVWDDSTVSDVPSTATVNGIGVPWLRVGLRHESGGQATLGSDTGKSRFERLGTLFVQVFTPAGGGYLLSDDISDTILTGLEGQTTPCGVWFRRGRLQEQGKDGLWTSCLVLIDFEYDQIH